LKEISTSVDSKYIDSTIGDSVAIIQVGRTRDSSWKADIFFRIEPNYELRFGAKAGESFFHEKTGFRIEETQLVSFPEDDALKKMLILPDEQAIPLNT